MLKFFLPAAVVFLFSMTSFSQKTKILFIGNSYTYMNDLPHMFGNLAIALGDTLFVDSSAPGGYLFSDHVNDPTTLAKINAQAWDYVILQEQSQWPSFPPQQVASGVYPYAKRLDSLIHVNNACTETVFYMTWGRENGDPGNCPVYPPVCTFDGMNARLRESYMQMTQDNHATVAPVAMAWKYIRDHDSLINLYQADQSHPSVEGTYLAACVFYATLFHKDPSGVVFTAGLSASEATTLQHAAAHTVLDSLSNWQQYGDIPNAAFTYSATGNHVQFTNQSANSTSYLWQFGDNATSTQTNVAHTYTNVATVYLTYLAAANGCREFTVHDSVICQSIPTGLSEQVEDLDVILSPNPAGDCITLTGNASALNIEIMNALGETVYSKDAIYSGEKIMIAGWPKGIYYVKLTHNRQSLIRRIIKS